MPESTQTMPTEQTQRRNFNLGVANGVLFGGADTLLDPNLVLVTFASFLTTSPVLLGLVYPLSQAGWFLPQLWVSGWMQSQSKAMPIYRAMAVVRTLCLVLLAITAATINDPAWHLIVFYALLMANQLAAGFAGLSFMDIVAKVVPPRQRGLFFAWRLSIGGLLGVALGLGIRWLLSPDSPIPFPLNFALMFGVASVLAGLGMAMFAVVQEPPKEMLVPRATLREQFNHAREILRKDNNYRILLRLRLALIVAGMGTPFFAVYAKTELNTPSDAVGVFLSVNIAASLVAYLVWGQVSARRGNRLVLQCGSALGVLVLALVLLAAPLSQIAGAQVVFVLIFLLIGVRDAAIGVSIGPLLLNLAPIEMRSLYIGRKVE